MKFLQFTRQWEFCFTTALDNPEEYQAHDYLACGLAAQKVTRMVDFLLATWYEYQEFGLDFDITYQNNLVIISG